MINCKKCNSEDLEVIENGPHKELICADCLTFQKFVTQKEVDRLEAVWKKRGLAVLRSN